MSTTAKNSNFEDLAFFPIRHHNLLAYYHKLKNTFWIPQEIDLSRDVEDMKTMKQGDRDLVIDYLTFFAQFDGLVNDNIFRNFQEDTSSIKEAGYFYAMQAANETIHNETYSIMIDAFIEDEDKKNKALNAIQQNPHLRKIADWLVDWMDPSRPLPERILAFICCEGIHFQPAFAAIFWLKKKGLMPGLSFANELIRDDEGVHAAAGCLLYGLHGGYDLPQKRVHEIIRSAVEVAEDFTNYVLRVNRIGLSNSDMLEYTKCVADGICKSLGYEEVYGCDNPYDWMVLVAMPSKTNFFEKKVAEYEKADEVEFDYDEEVDI